MDPFLIGILGAIVLFILLALGTHIGIALAASGFLGIGIIVGLEQALWLNVSGFYFKISNPSLITLPLFILMGYLASAGGISRDLFDSLSLWFGRFRGGLGIATVIGCTLFGTVCGSSVVTTAVFAKICAPEMRRHGYSKSISYAICASAGSIGMLIPPSILAIVYGMLSGVSIGKVLMAGVVPGLLWCGLFSVAIILMGKIKPSTISFTRIPSVTWRKRIASLRLWWPIFVVAASLIGGMYGGIFTASEAGAVAAFVLLVIFCLSNIIRDRKILNSGMNRELRKIFKDTATTSALIFLILGTATIFSNFVTLTGMAARIAILVSSLGLSPLGIVLLFSFIYLILGCFLDSMSMLCITVPVFNPIIASAGIDPLWYATIVIVSIEIGLITPPVGLNLYAAKGVAEPDVNLEDIISGIMPFLLAEIMSLIILLAFPSICTFLPGLVA